MNRSEAGRAWWANLSEAERAVVRERLLRGARKPKRNRPRYYLTKRMGRLVTAVRAIHDKGLPRPPLRVLAKLCGYRPTLRGAKDLACRISRLKKHGVIPEAWWPKGGQPRPTIWRRGAELHA